MAREKRKAHQAVRSANGVIEYWDGSRWTTKRIHGGIPDPDPPPETLPQGIEHANVAPEARNRAQPAPGTPIQRQPPRPLHPPSNANGFRQHLQLQIRQDRPEMTVDPGASQLLQNALENELRVIRERSIQIAREARAPRVGKRHVLAAVHERFGN